MSFLTSLGIILLSGLLLGSVCAKIRLPPLLGMLVVGIVLGPYVLDLISPQILNISADLRQLALIIILTRAGLSFDFGELKKKRTQRDPVVFRARLRGNRRVYRSRNAASGTELDRGSRFRLRDGGSFPRRGRAENAETRTGRLRHR